MPILLIIAFVVLGAGVFAHNHSTQIPLPTPSVQGETAPTPTDMPTPTDIPISSPTAKPSPTTPPKPTTIPQTSTDTSSWQYPGSQRINETTYTSSEDPKKITDWYKNKITALGYNAKSFVSTSSNDVIKNSLVAASGNKEVSVKITKNPGDLSATIKVVLDN